MEAPGYPAPPPAVSQTLPLMHPEIFPLTHTSSSTMPSSREGTQTVADGSQDKETSLVEMLNRVDEFDQIPRIQVAQVEEHRGSGSSGNPISTTPTVYIQIPVSTNSSGQGLIPVSVPIPGQEISMGTSPADGVEDLEKGNRKEKQPWHYHLGGIRHCRIPLTPEIKEVLEVAYISRIMSKNFRKEGQPEKERIARVTGLELDKVQEWFKNRRKKDKLIQQRIQGYKPPSGRRGRKPHTPRTSSHSVPPQNRQMPATPISLQATRVQEAEITIVSQATILTDTTTHGAQGSHQA